MNYKQLKPTWVLCLGLLAVAPAQGQVVKQLSLPEAIKLGLANSKQLKLSDAQAAIAQASLQEIKDRRLPSASFSGAYLRVTKPTVSLLLNLGNSSGGSQNPPPSVTQAMYAMGNASYTLFDGFQNAADIQAAKRKNQATLLELEADKQSVLQNIINAYSILYKANSSVALVKENLNQAHQRTLDFENLEKNGLVARNDLLKVKLQESNIQLSLLDAERDMHIANLTLDLLLGFSEDTQLQLDAASFESSKEIQSLSYWEQQAMEQRPDFKAIELRRQAAQYAIKSAKGAYYPSISLTGGYLALNVPNALTVSDAWNGGLGLRYNLSSLWKTSASVHMAKAQLMQVQTNQAMMSDQIRVQLYQSYEAYLLSQKKIDVLDVALQQATENYKIVKNKHNNSLATTTDLLEADVQQLQAKLNYAYAKADALVAYNHLLQTAGVLKN